MNKQQDPLIISGQKFNSRLLHCFGSINDKIDLKSAIQFILESKTNFLTIYTHGDLNRVSHLDEFPIGYFGLKYGDIKREIAQKKLTFLINTNHARTVNEAVKRAEICAKYSNTRIIKLEVLNAKLTRPVNNKVIEATKILLNKGFTVLPLINANLADIRILEKMGCNAIRILMSDIGSEKGLLNKELFSQICSSSKIPIIAEGGLRGPEDGYNAMLLGASAVLVNKALFRYRKPLIFLKLLKQSIKIGRLTYICNQERTK